MRKENLKKMIILSIFILLVLDLNLCLAFDEFSCMWFSYDKCHTLEGCGGEEVIIDPGHCRITCKGGGHVVWVTCYKIYV